MSFRDIKGQDRAIEYLENSMANNRIAHAYLFSGPEGVGKKLAALNFAKALNCIEKPGARPCDLCRSCKKIDAFNHPDVSLLKPEKEGSVIKIDDIRAMIMSIGRKPYEGRYKVVMIEEADAMRYDAQNALLKTLEEPPPESVLVLVTGNIKALFPTIVSRAQVIGFFPLNIGDVKSILTDVHKIDDVTAQILSRLSAGKPGEALRYMDAEFSRKRSRIINGLIDGTIFDADFGDAPKTDLKLYLDIMLAWYRDLAVAGACPDASASDFFNFDKADQIRAEAKNNDSARIHNAIKQITLTGLFLEQNANPKLAMSVLGVNICTR